MICDKVETDRKIVQLYTVFHTSGESQTQLVSEYLIKRVTGFSWEADD